MRAYTYEKYPSITFYIADFPTVDPNVPHRLSELREDFMVEGRDTNSYVQDEAVSVFGEKVNVIYSTYDFEKISLDYGLNSDIKIHSKVDNAVLLTDGNKIISIDKAKLKTNYIKDIIKEKVVYRLEPIKKDVVNSQLYKYLCDSFRSERYAEFKEGNLLRLSVPQVLEIQEMFPDDNFEYRYDSKDGGNIFVKWEDPMWVIYETSRSFSYKYP